MAMQEWEAQKRSTKALETIASVLTELWDSLKEQAEEDAREGRNGEWEAQWYVKSVEKGRVRYKSEEAAYEGGRYWLEFSTDPDSVEVYVCEAKVYPQEVVDREEWKRKQ